MKYRVRKSTAGRTSQWVLTQLPLSCIGSWALTGSMGGWCSSALYMIPQAGQGCTWYCRRQKITFSKLMGKKPFQDILKAETPLSCTRVFNCSELGPKHPGRLHEMKRCPGSLLLGYAGTDRGLCQCRYDGRQEEGRARAEWLQAQGTLPRAVQVLPQQLFHRNLPHTPTGEGEREVAHTTASLHRFRKIDAVFPAIK